MEKKKKSPIIYILAAIGGIIAVIVIGSAVSDLNKATHTGKASPIVNKEDKETHEDEEDVVNGNYYLGTEDSHVLVFKFSDENLIQVVDCGLGRETDKLTKGYGTYLIDKNNLTLALSNGDKFNMIIHNNGESLTLNNNEFNLIDPSELSERTQQEFE